MNKILTLIGIFVLCLSCSSSKNDLTKEPQITNLLITMIKGASPDFLNTEFKDIASFDSFKRSNRTLNQYQTQAKYKDGQLENLLATLTQHDQIISAKVAGLNTSKIRKITAKKMTKTKPIKE